MLKVKNSETRGGYRSNAGRKPLPDGEKKIGVTIYIKPKNLKKLKGKKGIKALINSKLKELLKKNV